MNLYKPVRSMDGAGFLTALLNHNSILPMHQPTYTAHGETINNTQKKALAQHE